MYDDTDSTYSYSESATPEVSDVSFLGQQTIGITGISFGSDASGITVTITATGSRHRRNTEEGKYGVDAEEAKKLKQKDIDKISDETTEKDEVDFEDIDDEIEVTETDGDDFEDTDDEEEFVKRDEAVNLGDADDEIEVNGKGKKVKRSIHRPKINSELFDKFDTVSDFWGVFTNTDAKTFEETKRLKAWKIGGTNPTKLTDESLGKDFSEELARTRRNTHVLRDTTFQCVPTTITDTSINCTFTAIPAGTYDVTVHVKDLGYAIFSGNNSVTVTPEITSVFPAEGSIHGGALLTITGSGFSPGEITVTLDGQACTVDEDSTSSNTIISRTPAHAEGSVPVVIISAGVSNTESLSFTYDLSKTPNISSIS